jgi:sulfide:quinone oxidoreductase
MYLAADNFRKRKVLKDIDVQFWSGGTKIFAIPKYEKTLLNVCKRSNIKLNFKERLVEIDGENKRAKFLGIGEDNKGQETWVDYNMIHVTPPQGPPDFIKNSPLANVGGWVDVDKYSLQHVQFKNVFALGDVAGIPASKTGAAVRKQAPVLVQNIFSFMKGEELKAAYNGYSSCPIVTGYGKLMLAEFDYENQPMETFPFDQSKERWSMYILKRYILPWLYWNQILPGRM